MDFVFTLIILIILFFPFILLVVGIRLMLKKENKNQKSGKYIFLLGLILVSILIYFLKNTRLVGC
jgi:hypothetical protein